MVTFCNHLVTCVEQDWVSKLPWKIRWRLQSTLVLDFVSLVLKSAQDLQLMDASPKSDSTFLPDAPAEGSSNAYCATYIYRTYDVDSLVFKEKLKAYNCSTSYIEGDTIDALRIIIRFRNMLAHTDSIRYSVIPDTKFLLCTVDYYLTLLAKHTRIKLDPNKIYLMTQDLVKVLCRKVRDIENDQ